MNRLGMALAILVWNTLSCLTGWATSRYGLFGLPKMVPASLLLNYMGIIALIAGGVTYTFVKSNTAYKHSGHKGKEKLYNMHMDKEKEGNGRAISLTERVGALLAAMFCGVFYGSMWTPVTYIKAHPDVFQDTPVDGIHYLFSFFSGVLCTSTAIFIVYSLVKRNSPWICAETALPSLFAGALFALGMTTFVVAIDNLNASIAYPICTMAPGLVVSLWSILYFREITGRRNLMLLATAYTFTLLGVTLVTVSKEVAFP